MNQSKPKTNNSKKFNLEKGLMIGTTVGLVTLVGVTPSYAFSIEDFFQDVVEGAKASFENAKAELSASIEGKFGGVKVEAETAIKTGDMKATDPVKSSDALKEQLKGKGTNSETNTVEGAVSISKELERENARATVAAVLGEKGQKQTKKEIEATEQTVSQTKELADSAQTAESSQDVLKIIAAQNAQIASMLGQSRTDKLQARHDTQQTNLMLSQMAEQGASERKRQNLAIDGINAQFIELAGYTSLKTTAGESKP
ncbi:MAG: hypothetical protein KME64_37645 [Scytonematopsis contorta HA4267-MV1]|jgi:hypothetical protein|nr:hypothetical protein [Scytonematopsis contorta HA4267-MV1]